jgi:IS30 family transposase
MSHVNDTTDNEKYKIEKTSRYITERNRHEIALLYRNGHTSVQIAEELGFHRTSISREITRGLCPQLTGVISWKSNKSSKETKIIYDPILAQSKADALSHEKGRLFKIDNDKKFFDYVVEGLKVKGYSPEVIVGRARYEGIVFNDPSSVKTIYSWIYNGLIPGFTIEDLLYKKSKVARAKRASKPKVAGNNIRGRSIEERTKAINERLEFGNWEGDLVVGSGRAALFTLTERMTRQEIIFKIPNKKQVEVVKCIDMLEKLYGKAFKEIFKSITFDNGSEFVNQKLLERSYDRRVKKPRLTVYYAHPYCSFERGTNENCNRMIRRFIPKGTDIGKFSNAEIRDIQNRINAYPRGIFGFRTSDEVLLKCYGSAMLRP